MIWAHASARPPGTAESGRKNNNNNYYYYSYHCFRRRRNRSRPRNTDEFSLFAHASVRSLCRPELGWQVH